MPQFNELLGEYQQLYNQQCENFVQDSQKLWPINSKNGADKARNVFNLGWDLETIISNWIHEETLLPDQYQYELYSQLILDEIFTIILSLIVVIILLCCCQIFCIPKFKVFMRCCYINVVTDTKSTFEKYFLFFGIIILSLFLCAVCGFSYTDKQIESSLLQVKCISLWMLENTIQQQQDQGWKSNWNGILYINNQIQLLSEELNETQRQQAIQQLSIIQTQDLRQEYQIENNYITSLYQNNYEIKLINPNPFTQQQFIESDFIEQIGPYTKSGTVTNLLSEELSTRNQAINLMNSIKQKSQSINSTIIISNLNQSQQLLNDFSFEVIKFLSKFEQTLSTKSWIFDTGVAAYKRFLVFICFTTFFLIISFSLVTWLRSQKLGFLLHISWIALAVLLIIGFLLLIFVYYVSLINNNMVCSLANGLIHDKKILKEIIKIMKPAKHLIKNKSFFQQIEVCLYENGDFVSYFHLHQTFHNIIDLDQSIVEINNLNYSHNVIKFYKTVVQQYFTNYSNVINLNNVDHPEKILRKLNNWTDYNIDHSLQLYQGGCKVSQDEWEWKSKDCKYYKADKLKTKQLQKYLLVKQSFYTNPRNEFGMAICLIFDDCNDDYANQRYQNQYQRCKKNKSISNIVNRYFTSIKLYIESVNKTFKPILLNLTEYENQLVQLDREIEKQIVNLTYYGSQLNLIFGITKNLQQTLNCSYIKQGAIRFRNTFCTTLLNGIFFMYIYLIAICCLLSCLGILSVWSAMRCIPKSEQHQVFLEAAIGPMQQRTVQRKSIDIN